ncbi:MAG: hypothetical protein H0V44_00805 [Planctomycetes bacterium]|nr:hypothetical protein [Planctomycetota bacterium]
MDKINGLILRSQNAVRTGAIGGYSLVGIAVIALAVIGLLYLFNRA